MNRLDAAARQEEREALRGLLTEMLEKLGRPAPVYGINPDLPAGEIARQLWRLCGARAKVVRTKLDRLEEEEAGRRVRRPITRLKSNGAAAGHRVEIRDHLS